MSEISVIVPVYNVEDYLERCIDSILAQTFQNFDLILIDDGSPDRCGEICDNYAKMDNRVVVIHQENGGLAHARNRGIEWTLSNSDTKWICFIDSDDWINKTYLEGLYEAAKNCGCMISVCDFVHEEKKEYVPSEILVQSLSPSDLYNNFFYIVQSACSKLFSKELFEDEAFRFPKGILYEDSAIVYQIIFSQKEIAFTNKSTYFYYQRSGSITNSEWSPNKMVYCQVQKKQLQWLINHNYDECIKTCLCHYLGSLHYNESMIHKNPKYKKYSRIMRKICRDMLRKYGKEYRISIEEYPHFYQAGYPHIVEFYWIIKAQLKKIKLFYKTN